MWESAAVITPGPSFDLFLIGAVPFLLLAAVWLIVIFFALKGEEVDRPNRMAQVYGYTVCLITLIVSLVSLSSILSAMFESGQPPAI